MSRVQRQFEDAYDTYADSIFRYAMAKARDRQEALGITQETFVKTWEYLSSGHEIRAMRPFLYRVAHNVFCKRIEKSKRSTSLEALIDLGYQARSDDDIEDEAAEREEQKKALSDFDTLDDAHRDVLMMRYGDQLSIREIAAALGETANTVSVRIHRAKKHLYTIYTKKHG